MKNYRFGFNGQERETEIGSSTTSAEFWMYDGRLGRRWNRDPITNPSLSPYAVNNDNPIRFTDPNGDNPGDIIIFFTGADLYFMGGESTVMKGIGDDVTADNKDATYIVYQSGYLDGHSSAVLESAKNAVVEAKTLYPDSRVIIYGYSYGGKLANDFTKILDAEDIEVELLVTVDAANSKEKYGFDAVNRDVSKNVKRNLNFYESNDPEGVLQKYVIDSHGKPFNGMCGQVSNYDCTSEFYKGKKIDHYNIDDHTANMVSKTMKLAFSGTLNRNNIPSKSKSNSGGKDKNDATDKVDKQTTKRIKKSKN